MNTLRTEAETLRHKIKTLRESMNNRHTQLLGNIEYYKGVGNINESMYNHIKVQQFALFISALDVLLEEEGEG